MKGNTNKRMFKAGGGLDDHTYGGLKLSEMKKILDREECTDAVNSSLVQGGTQTPFAGFQPNQRNSKHLVPDPTEISNKSLSPVRSKPKKPNPSMVSVLPETQKQLPQLPTGYVNMFPSPSRYENAHLSKNEEEEEGEDEDGDQEIYIEPGTLEDDDVPEESDSNIYQNYNFSETEPQKTYVNMSELQNTPPAPSPSHTASIYANVTYQGKPLTPPRVKPKMKPRPRQ